MILGALLALVVYTLVSVLRARHRFLELERFWSSEKGALLALSHCLTKEIEPCLFHPGNEMTSRLLNGEMISGDARAAGQSSMSTASRPGATSAYRSSPPACWERA